MLYSNSERHYQDSGFARQYLGAYEGPLRLKTLAARIIAMRERHCVARALRQCQPPPAMVLDMPCGTGKLGEVLAEMEVKVTAADLSLAMMEQATKGAYPISATFVPCNAERLPFDPDTFDTVICLRLMHLVPPVLRRKILGELARVTSRHVIVSFGVLTPFQRLRLRLRRAIFRGKSTPYPVGPAELRSEIENAGLCIARQQSILPVLSCECLLTLEKVQQG